MRIARVPAAIALALGALACARPPPPPPPTPPPPAAFFWEAQTPGGGILFLLGSVHVGSARELLLDPRVEDAFARAEELVVEVDTQALAPYEALEATERNGGFLPPDLALRDVIGAETHDRLVAYLRAHRYPVDLAARMRPWLLAQIVAQIEFESAGLDPDNGVDAWFLRRAAGTRGIAPLETLDEQMQLFASLSDALQEELLREMLDETDAFLETTHAILRAWEGGDEAALLELLLGAMHDPQRAEFHRRVFLERNHRMSERLEALAGDARVRFAVIGTGHLIGPESVPALLEARGFAVRRVPDAFVRSAPEEPPIPEAMPGSEPEATGGPPPAGTPPGEPLPTPLPAAPPDAGLPAPPPP